mgnify:CR=1 FL=1|tara:strand:+ start:997 stop:1380 length:384 start_codon:yes stop_codon:yes gene_type:complete
MKKLEKILTNTLEKLATDYENKFLSQSEYSDNALETSIEICEKNLPFMDECKDKRQMIVFTLSDNPKYCVDLVDYYYGNGIDEEWVSQSEPISSYHLNQFKSTLAHDLLGLYNKDEHFVPRINNETV